MGRCSDARQPDAAGTDAGGVGGTVGLGPNEQRPFAGDPDTRALPILDSAGSEVEGRV
jgi:hypothetical protein